MKPSLSTISCNNLSTLPLSPHSLNFSIPKLNPTQIPKLFFNTSNFSYSKHPKFLLSSIYNTETLIQTQNNSYLAISECLPTTQLDGYSNQLQNVEIKNPNLPPFVSSFRAKFSPTDYALFLLAFIACTACAAFVSFVAAAVPTLYAMGRAANSFAKLADTVREELPSTMAAVRLSGMEISDLTLELTDLSQEISDGINKSAQAVAAAEVGMRQIGARAREHATAMIEERANLPVFSLRPAVSGAAKKTYRLIGRAWFILKRITGDANSEENP